MSFIDKKLNSINWLTFSIPLIIINSPNCNSQPYETANQPLCYCILMTSVSFQVNCPQNVGAVVKGLFLPTEAILTGCPTLVSSSLKSGCSCTGIITSKPAYVGEMNKSCYSHFM